MALLPSHRTEGDKEVGSLPHDGIEENGSKATRIWCLSRHRGTAIEVRAQGRDRVQVMRNGKEVQAQGTDRVHEEWQVRGAVTRAPQRVLLSSRGDNTALY